MERLSPRREKRSTFFVKEGITMGRLQLWLAILFVLVFVGHSRAQGTISWTSGYPKASCNSGAILVNGSVSLDSGWTRGTATITAWKDGEESKTSVSVAFCGSTFDGAIGGLNSCESYNVV